MLVVLSATRGAVAAVVSVAIMFLSSAAAGDVIYVDADRCPGVGKGTRRAPYCSIQVALDAAMDGDEVVVAPGIYFEAIDFLGKAVWLHSSGGSDVTTIDGTGFYHVVQCVSGEGPDTVLDGFTVTGGEAAGSGMDENGAGMINDGSSPTVTNCEFTDNTAADDGGGMYNRNGSPLVTNTTFTWNHAEIVGGRGGGMYNDNASPILIDCMFNSNQGASGGAMRNENGSNPAMVNCAFFGNRSEEEGGAMGRGGSSTILINCTFISNDAQVGHGGAIDAFGGTAIGCVFRGNSSDASGGALRAVGTIIPTLVNCSFISNSSYDGYGGAIAGGAIAANCTFVGNSCGLCEEIGGAVHGGTLSNCIVWDNIPNQIASNTTVTYSNVQGGFPGTGNIDADPLFVDPDNGDYRLQASSPCIDAGHNWLVPQDSQDLDDDGDTTELMPFDLDGNPRFSGGEADFDPGCGVPAVVDMGAYEYQFSPADEVRFGDLTGDGAVGMADLSDLLDAWGPCAADCCLADLDLDGVVGTSDLLAMLANWGS